MSNSNLQASSSSSSAPEVKLSSNYCSVCDVQLSGFEERRVHAKSERHVANLKRRLVGMNVLKTPEEELQRDYGRPESDPEQSDSASSMEGSDSEEVPEFVPGDCLFCSHSSSNLDENVLHMNKAHGLFIPDRDRLIVDLDALVRYLHLVIFGYRECLYCHSQRRTAAAAQQHMIGKGHCKFDLSSEDSEFADFYADATTSARNDDVDEEEGGTPLEEAGGAKLAGSVTKIDDTTVRLPSGKILSHRSTTALALQSRQQSRTARAQPHHPSVAAPSPASGSSTQPTPQQPSTQEAPPTSTALAKSAKREAALALQLENLSARDRAALIHLPTAEQRSLLAVQKKELAQAKRAEKRFWSRVETMNNTVKRSTFRNDEPGHDGRRRWGV